MLNFRLTRTSRRAKASWQRKFVFYWTKRYSKMLRGS